MPYMQEGVMIGMILGDCHFSDKTPLRRRDNFLEAQFTKLSNLEKIISESKDVDALFLLGDVFDIPHPDIWLVNRVIDSFSKLNKVLPLGIYAIVGNHCVHGRVASVDETALGTLYSSGIVKRLTGNHTIHSIPFVGIDYMINHTPEVYKGSNQIILTHNMLLPKPAIFKHILTADVSALAPNTTIFAGHYHSPFQMKFPNGCQVVNPGVLVRTDIAERNIIPSVVKFVATQGTTLQVSYERIPLEQDNGNEVFNLEDYKEEKVQKLDLEKFINGLKQSRFESQDLEKLIQEVGTLSNVSEKVIQEALTRIKTARSVVK